MRDSAQLDTAPVRTTHTAITAITHHLTLASAPWATTCMVGPTAEDMGQCTEEALAAACMAAWQDNRASWARTQMIPTA